MVADVSRWSRDNLKNAQYLKLLKQNSIRFFVLNTEYDLYDADDEYFLTMNVALNERSAKLQTYKSIMCKIERAKKGRPSTGARPFGRNYDEENGWFITEKGRKVQEIVKLYLEDNLSFKKLANK